MGASVIIIAGVKWLLLLLRATNWGLSVIIRTVKFFFSN